MNPNSTLLRRGLGRLYRGRVLSTSHICQAQEGGSPFQKGPAPPRLPNEEQELFEKLQRQSTGAFSSPRPQVVVNQSPQSKDQSSSSDHVATPRKDASDSKGKNEDQAALSARIKAAGEGEELHPDIRRGARPEFEGDRNPKTGEVGGPKNDPLRWAGDWSYNGRVTDF